MNKRKRSFSENVVKVVVRIPKGRTLSYQEVARRSGNKKAARAVGNILNKYYRDCVENKKPTIPCHRVICADGKIGGYILGKNKKKDLLKKETRARRISL